LRPDRWDVPALAEAFRGGKPFSHVVLDEFVEPGRLSDLVLAFDEEPANEIHDEIFSMMASATTLEHAAFRAFHDELGSAETRRALGAITGKPLGRADMRAYAYLPGHYLLPHADHQAAVGRLIAYAFYVDTRELEGGELELFDCTFEAGEIVATRAAKRITATPNRVVLFEVSEASLHQVREVTRGVRLSLAGWFYP
jgi:hypothetical protein